VPTSAIKLRSLIKNWCEKDYFWALKTVILQKCKVQKQTNLGGQISKFLSQFFSKMVNVGPHFWHLLKALGKRYIPKFCGPKFKNKEVLGGQILNFIPIFSELMNFVPHIWRSWKAQGKGYKPPKFCGPKFRNKKSSADFVVRLTSPLVDRLFNHSETPEEKRTGA